ncbi:response regulator transcription factor [Peptococcus simiae]|uniref:Stage 0 sporulation protein A homolog n=1 Tax=Peptococcus simiae TaxID=1643805 RepID=A0ABW9GZK7_9FIRM
MTSLLIIEDDAYLAQGLATALAPEVDTVFHAANYVEAVTALKDHQPSLILLDIQLPDGSGFDLLPLAQLEADRIICLTVKDAEWEIVRALEAGAHDYLTKPFSLAELRARVRAQLRELTPNRHYRDGYLQLDFNQLVFTVKASDLSLSSQEIRFLSHLLAAGGQTVSRPALIEAVWPMDQAGGGDNALSMLAARLRQKIEPDPHQPRYIQTVHGRGYRWGEEGPHV